MTGSDRDLVAKKLARIEDCVREIRTLGHPERIHTDLREQRFFEHTLQIAIQSLLDIASHIVSAERFGEPHGSHELVDLLVRHAWLPAELAPSLHGMIGFRNILVHGYDTVDLTVVEDIARHRLDELLAFAGAVRARLAAAP
jgi:uncharacterized protein YutE (UPF0331/DUF86 family)